jgi:hypothetical protein
MTARKASASASASAGSIRYSMLTSTGPACASIVPAPAGTGTLWKPKLRECFKDYAPTA